MADPDIRTLIDEYLAETILMQLATAKGAQPWTCTVHYASDERPNFYFLSRPTRRHSEELRDNPRVAGVIVKPHAIGERVRGLQFEGTASEADGEQAERGKAVYKERFGFDRAENHYLYVVTPSRIVLFDEVNFPDNPQQVLSLQ